MKKSYYILLGLLTYLSPIFGQSDADTVTSASKQTPAKIVTINTSAGILKAKLYDDVPNHVRTFIERAKRGEYDGTLFTRVLPEFMIQGGAPDSRNAPAGARCGFGDRNSEIMPEMRPHHFNKRGALAAPRQNDDINPQKKSDMSQFYIVQGKVYTNGELDTLEMIANQDIKEKAMQKFFYPVRAELRMQKASNKREYQKRLRKINAQVDSMVRATPGHLLFTKEQRKAYTTEGGCHHLDGNYTVYGELIEGFDVLDAIAGQPRDEYDRPKKDVRIIQLTIEN
ncbi:peptidylprolyl isomerase [Parabacteroides johnsonii]|uniref:peptidylprolyl isomerase n=1 Tax=Parabacteroides johnsonii TaxID=387661 RepID=UPI00307DA2F9